MNSVITLPVGSVVYRADLYPRIEPDAALIQRYAEQIDVLPPIEVNQHNILIDGYHRLGAHKVAGAETIRAIVTETASEEELYALAIQRNAAHGWQMDDKSKKMAAIRLYRAGTGLSKPEIGKVLSASPRTISRYLGDVDRDLREQRKETIYRMWLACHTLEEIAAACGVVVGTIHKETETFFKNGQVADIEKSLDFALDRDFTPPLFNVWTYAAKTNAVTHFGNTEQRIVDNLLYLYTEPGDIVVDPFAGGGSTVDVCKRRGRRYWCSDRKVVPGREADIRQHDITDGVPPLNAMWSDVRLTYLDPPYWKQAEGQYSTDATDLANMELEAFTTSLATLVKDIAKRQSRGAIALVIQPTQWKSPDRRYTDHIIDIVQAVGNKRLALAYRISVPYQTEQYNAQQVNWAKEHRKLLVINREVIVWEVQG